MAVFDDDFAFSCLCYVSDIQHALAKSTKIYEIRACISGKHVVKNFEVDFCFLFWSSLGRYAT